MPSMIGAVTGPLTAQATGQIQPLAKDSKAPLIGGLLGVGMAGLTGGLSQMFTPEAFRMGQFGSMLGGLFT